MFLSTLFSNSLNLIQHCLSTRFQHCFKRTASLFFKKSLHFLRNRFSFFYRNSLTFEKQPLFWETASVCWRNRFTFVTFVEETALLTVTHCYYRFLFDNSRIKCINKNFVSENEVRFTICVSTGPCILWYHRRSHWTSVSLEHFSIKIRVVFV